MFDGINHVKRRRTKGREKRQRGTHRTIPSMSGEKITDWVWKEEDEEEEKNETGQPEEYTT